MDYYLECTRCGSGFDNDYGNQICAKCGGILEVVYKGRLKIPKSAIFWDYESELPDSKYTHYALGGTALVESNLHHGLFLKLELYNPTGSFKDRGSVVEVAKAKEYGYDEIAVASTGNMAYSLAYYARAAGIKTTVFIGGAANPNKVKDILMTHDAKIHRVHKDFSAAQDAAIKYSRRTGAFLAGDYCYRKEGQRTMAYEVAAQLKGFTHIIVPVGNATLVSGIAKALCEMRINAGIIAVQARGCSPLAKAFKRRKPIRYEIPHTKADAIAVGNPAYGDEAVREIRESGGAVVTVEDKEMAACQEMLYRSDGVRAELAGAASIAAYRKLKFRKGDRVIAIISGGNI